MKLRTEEKIKLIANRKNLSISDIATDTGQTIQNLSNKLKRNNFKEDELQAIAKAMDCTLQINFVDNATNEIL